MAPAPGSPVDGSRRLDFGDTLITASAAITVDSTSIVYAGYTTGSGNNIVGAVRINLALWTTDHVTLLLFPFNLQFHITATTFLQTPGNAFYNTSSMSSPVRQLQWQSGLDYIYVATESSVSV